MQAMPRTSVATALQYKRPKIRRIGRSIAYSNWGTRDKIPILVYWRYSDFSRCLQHTNNKFFKRNRIMKDANIRKKSKLNLIPVELAQQMVHAYDKQRSTPAAKDRSKAMEKKMEIGRAT